MALLTLAVMPPGLACLAIVRHNTQPTQFAPFITRRQRRAMSLMAQFKWESGRVDVTKLPAPNHGGRRGGPKSTSGRASGSGGKGGGGAAATVPAQHSHPSPAAAMQACNTRLLDTCGLRGLLILVPCCRPCAGQLGSLVLRRGRVRTLSLL